MKKKDQPEFLISEPIKPEVIIAIDPDVDASGVVFLDLLTKTMQCELMTLPILVDNLQYMRRHCKYKFVVVVEASWLIKGNWHLDYKDTTQRAAAKGYKVGRNHEVGLQIIQFCRHLDVPYEEKYPLKKCWSGADGKITQKELNQLLEGMGLPLMDKKEKSQEKRDAALLALDRSGLPLIMAPAKRKMKQR